MTTMTTIDTSNDIRSLTSDEVEHVSGGFAPLIVAGALVGAGMLYFGTHQKQAEALFDNPSAYVRHVGAKIGGGALIGFAAVGALGAGIASNVASAAKSVWNEVTSWF